MAHKILTNSPHYVNLTGTGLQSATIEIYLYTGTQTTDRQATPKYTLTSTSVNSNVTFEIAELIKDYIPMDYTGGSYTSNTCWVDYRTKTTVAGVTGSFSSYVQDYACLGYSYFTELANFESEAAHLQSSNYLQRLSGTTTYVPYDKNIVTKFRVYTGSGFNETAVTSSVLSGHIIRYVTVTTDITKIEFENSSSEITTLYVDNVSECKHTPYKLTFINKEGALEDLWMFKKSELSIDIKRKEFQNNQMNANGTYTRSNHQFKTIGIESREKMNMNSGFVPEEMNENFKQLLQSELVWLTKLGLTLPVVLKKTDMRFQTRLDDKLINYDVEVSFAYNHINTVR